MTKQNIKASSPDTQKKFHVLIALWGLGAEQEAMAWSSIPGSVKKGSEPALWEYLEKGGMITRVAQTKGRGKPKTLLTQAGIAELAKLLAEPSLHYQSNVGGWLVNSLIKWSRSDVTSTSTSGKISSYEVFKTQAAASLDQLNRDHNYSGLVPIWHLRQVLGARVERGDFNRWMISMQSDEIFYMQAGDVPSATEEQLRNSISHEIRGTLFFVSKK